MVCAAPWKTCNCPWFSYSHLEDDDRLNDMRVPYIPHDNVVEVIEMPHEPPAQPPVRRMSTRSHRRADRDLDRTDDALAAHLHAQLRLGSTPTVSEVRRSNPAVHVYGLGNSGAHHMNDSYAVRPIVASARAAARPPVARSFFSRRVVRETPRETLRERPRTSSIRTVTASTMAGLSRDGTKRGANRVGTWLNHVEVDDHAVKTIPDHVEVDDWRMDGSVAGID